MHSNRDVLGSRAVVVQEAAVAASEEEAAERCRLLGGVGNRIARDPNGLQCKSSGSKSPHGPRCLVELLRDAFELAFVPIPIIHDDIPAVL